MKISIFKLNFCALLLLLSCTSAFSQTSGDQKISSVMDDKISQLNTALTRIIDRQEDLKNNLAGIEGKLTSYDKRIVAQEVNTSKNLLAEIEALKAKMFTEIASIQELIAPINDLTSAIDEIKTAQLDGDADIKDTLESVINDVAHLKEKELERGDATKFEVVEVDGLPKLFSRDALSDVAATLPSKENCSEIGAWFVEYVLLREVNRFYVMAADEYMVCKHVNNAWAAISMSGSHKAYVVYERVEK